MAHLYTSTSALLRDVQAASDRAYPDVFNEAVRNWRIAQTQDSLSGLVNLITIDPGDTSYEYDLELPEVSAGEASVMTCESDPEYTGDTPTELRKYFLSAVETPVKVCFNKCGPDTVDEHVRKKELQAMEQLGKHLWRRAWYGHADQGLFGLTNHPDITDITESQVAGAPKTMAEMSASEIVQLMLGRAWGMRNPKLWISSNAYFNAFGKITDQSGGCCKTVGELVAQAFRNLPTTDAVGQLSEMPIEVVDLLDARYLETDPRYAHQVNWHRWTTLTPNGGVLTDVAAKDFMIITDGSTLDMRASAPQRFEFRVRDTGKQVHAIRWIKSGGLDVNKYNSVRITYGV